MRAAILLAAGGSRRFGRADKLMARLTGRPLFLHALDRARESGVRRVIVVLPARGQRVGRAILPRPGIAIVVARRHREGLGASLAAGIAALRPIEREVLVFLGDMPLATAPRALRLKPGEAAVRPIHRGKPGHPMLVRTAAARAVRLVGDRGLAAALAPIGSIPGGPGHLLDVDTPAVLARLRRLRRG